MNRLVHHSHSALKTGGAEVAREKWDAADVHAEMDMDEDILSSPEALKSILPDWTSSPLPTGAPSARSAPLPPASVPPTPAADIDMVISPPVQILIGA